MSYSTEPAACELSLDLTAQELLTLPTIANIANMVEIDDILTVDPALGAHAAAANADAAPADRARIEEMEDSVEIELSAEQILALLEGTG